MTFLRSPIFPEPDTLWKFAERVAMWKDGTSPSVSLCRKQAGSASRTRGRVGPAQGRRDRGAHVPCALAAKQATRDIPIVILAGEPVETGIVPSIASPGGNVTGVSLMASASNGKSVELFRDMLPSVRRVGVLGHATNPVFAKAMLDEVRLAYWHF